MPIKDLQCPLPNIQNLSHIFMVVLRGGLCVDYLAMIKHINKNVYCLSDKLSNLFTSEIENVIDIKWKMVTGKKLQRSNLECC